MSPAVISGLQEVVFRRDMELLAASKANQRGHPDGCEPSGGQWPTCSASGLVILSYIESRLGSVVCADSNMHIGTYIIVPTGIIR